MAALLMLLATKALGKGRQRARHYARSTGTMAMEASVVSLIASGRVALKTS
jgi:aspartate aminotransferase-like enzyme